MPAELIARLVVESGVQLRDGVVVVFFWCGEDQSWPLQLALAGVDVHLAALFDGDRRIREQFLKGGQRLFELALLQQLARQFDSAGRRVLCLRQSGPWWASGAGVFLRL
jgi:hypothetical protein